MQCILVLFFPRNLNMTTKIISTEYQGTHDFSRMKTQIEIET